MYADKKYKELRQIMSDSFALGCNNSVLFSTIEIIIRYWHNDSHTDQW